MLPKIGIGLLVFILIVILLVSIFGDAALKTGVETGATKAMKVNVALDDISLSMLAGKLKMNDLVVDNPEGYQNPTFLELGNAYVDLKTTSLLSDTIEIEKMQFDNITLTMEQKGLTNNLKEILNNLPKSEPAEKPAEDTSEEEAAGKNLLIKQLDINGVTVKVKLLPVPGRADTLTLKINPIHMENIGTEEKINTPELVKKVLLAIAGGIADQGKGLLPTDMVNDLSGQLAEQGKQLMEEGQKQVEGLIDSGSDIGKEATEALKGLNPFKKKEE